MKKSFSWSDVKERAIIRTQEYYQTLAKQGNTLVNDGWVRDARLSPPQYTVLNKAIRTEMLAKQKRHADKVSKIWMKN